MQLFEDELTEDELLAAAMFFKFTDYWHNNFDRPLNLFNTTEVLKQTRVYRFRSNRLKVND